MYPPSMLSSLIISAILLACLPHSNGAPSLEYEPRSRLLGAPHIIGGVDIDIEKAPYQISIQLVRVHICGAAIVSKSWALTAAHCVHEKTSGPLWLKRIKAGSTMTIPFVGWGGSIHQIEQAIVHPDYNIRQVDYDVAAIKVANDFVWSKRVWAAILPPVGVSENSFIDYNVNATVTGWGMTETGGKFFLPWFLKSVQIPLIPRRKCAQVYPVTSRTLCGAGTGKGGPCHGDSGGPMVHQNYLLGLSSYVIRKCNDPEFPSGFTNLLNEEIRSFVQKHTGL